jgi:hypothetical protein
MARFWPLSCDEDSLYELAFTVIREYSDFEHVYRDYLKEVANAG